MSDSEATVPLDEVEDELYGVAPDEFVRRRSELVRAAKQAGDRERADAIAALRKPTAPAWALDSFVRTDSTWIDALLDLAARLRDAVDRGVGDEIRDLMRERARTMKDVMAAIGTHADARGEPLSPSVAGQVERTLRAAMASEEHARSLRRGVLATALDEPGLGAIDAPLGGRSRADRPTADPNDGDAEAARRPAAERRQQRSLERQVVAAEAAVALAEEALAESSRRRDALADEQQELRRRLDEVEQRLRSERDRGTQAEHRLREARSALRTARTALTREQRAGDD